MLYGGEHDGKVPNLMELRCQGRETWERVASEEEGRSGVNGTTEVKEGGYQEREWLTGINAEQREEAR